MSYVSFEQKRKKIESVALWVMCGILGTTALVLSVILILKIGAVGVFSVKDPDSEVLKKPGNSATTAPTAEPTPEPYNWINEDKTTIETRFNTPEGYTRIECEEGSFADYLRNYPLKEYGEKARYWSGGNLVESGSTATVGVFVQQDQLTKNQQCADTCIMLYAEYLWENERYDEIIFDFASGFRCDYLTWVSGKRIEVNGNKVKWVDGGTKDDYSYENFFTYLKWVYVYASTDSLVTQFKSRSYDELQIGDIIVATARELEAAAQLVSPDLAATISLGHAMIVVDIAVNEAGEKVFMLAEGNTPATECAVVENPNKEMSVWFKVGEDGKFQKGTAGIRWSSEWFYTFSEMN